MESLVGSLRRLQQRLQEADIPSAVIEGVAIALLGEPRVTRDVDLKRCSRAVKANTRFLHRSTTCILPPGAYGHGALGVAARSRGRGRISAQRIGLRGILA